MKKYLVVHDNYNRQFAVVNIEEIGENNLRFLNNVIDVAGCDTEEEAYEVLDVISKTSSAAGDAAIRTYNNLRKEARELYDKQIWNNDKQFNYIISDFKQRMNMSYGEPFSSQLEASRYLKRLIWMLINEFQHDSDFNDCVKSFVETTFKDNPSLNASSVVRQFTNMVTNLQLSDKERERVNKLAEIVCC